MNNKNYLTLSFATVFILLSSGSHGHGGTLNQYGCHRQSSDNTYHCHSGLLDGQSFPTEQGMITAYNVATGIAPIPYDRDDYMTSWLDADRNCVNARHEVLAIESLIPPTFSASGCTVVAGLWYDPFTGQEFTSPGDLDIDHFVPLAEAHKSGAWEWEADKKSAYANDLLNAKALIAVSASANRAKGSDDPALWLPPNADFHCEYVKDWTEIKRRHELHMDVAERAAIEGVLGADIEYAARVESGGWNETAGQFSSAVFGLGIRRTNECAYTRQAASTESIEVTISVLPDVAHLNQDFSIFLVAELSDGLYSLNHLGQFIPFTGAISTLAPFQDNVYLQQSHELTAFSGILNEALTFNLYIGYLTVAGDFVYTSAPVLFSVVE